MLDFLTISLSLSYIHVSAPRVVDQERVPEDVRPVGQNRSRVDRVWEGVMERVYGVLEEAVELTTPLPDNPHPVQPLQVKT